ncbi:RDD family protein [Microbacterium sp. P03]|uniref:RDD family protein n=1 Tax=Microbacterium sp. P03 TaxID=3366946 RepID=UPI0037476D90
MSPAPSTPAAPGSTTCCNCGQEIPAGTPRCLFCGVPQDAQSARLVVAPHGVLGAPPPLLAPPSATAPGAPSLAPRGGSAADTTTPWNASPLGAAFSGAPAGAGSRLLALTIDVLAVSVVVLAVGLLTGSAALAVVVAAELLIGLWVLQARTGLGLGKLLLRLRVSRIEEPFSPGVDRAFVRGAVTAAGALVLLAGAWAVEASAAWDRSGLRRSWADRAAGTVVVALPPRVPGLPRRVRVASRRASPAEDATHGAPSIAPPQVSIPVPAPSPDVVAAGVGFGRAADSITGRATASALGPGGREPAAVSDAEAPEPTHQDAVLARAAEAPPTEAPGIPPLDVPAVPPLPPEALTAPATGTDIGTGRPAPADPAAAQPAPGPRRSSRPAAPDAAPTPPPLTPPPLTPPPPPLSLGEPQRRSTPPRVDRAGGSVTGAPGPRRSAAVPLDGEADAPGPRRRRSSAVPNEDALEPSAHDGLLLLVFDTGQREQLPIPVAANLGRNPAASEPSDLLIPVRDPDSTVSKTHLRLEHSRSGTWVTDAGSTNGTDLLDEEGRITPLASGVRTLVEDGVRVRLGNRVFTVNRLIGAS